MKLLVCLTVVKRRSYDFRHWNHDFEIAESQMFKSTSFFPNFLRYLHQNLGVISIEEDLSSFGRKRQ